MNVSGTDDAAGNCPALPYLLALAVGDHSCECLDEVLVHVHQCEHCRILLATLEDEDGCDDDSQGSESALTHFGEETGYQNLMRRLSAIGTEMVGPTDNAPGNMVGPAGDAAGDTDQCRVASDGVSQADRKPWALASIGLVGLGLALIMTWSGLATNSFSGFRAPVPYGFQDDLFPIDSQVKVNYDEQTRTLELADQMIIAVPFNAIPRGDSYTMAVSLRPQGDVRRFGIFWGSGLLRHEGHETRTQHILAVHADRSQTAPKWVLSHSELLLAMDSTGTASVTDFRG